MLKRSPVRAASDSDSPPPAGQWEHAAKEDHQKKSSRVAVHLAKHEMDLDNRGSLQPLRKAGDTPCCQSHAWNIAPGSDSRSNKNISVRNCCSTAPSSSSRKASSFPLERMAHGLGPVQCTGVSK